MIRRITAQDRESLLQLLHNRGTFNPTEVNVAMELVDDAITQKEKSTYQVFGYFDPPDQLSGYICFGLIPITDSSYDLYWIAVDAKTGRKGIGGKLLHFMEDFVKQQNGKNIYIETSSTPPYESARAFYLKNDYKVACVLEDFYRAGDNKWLFEKKIK